jgi:hypothetical protein
MKTFKLDLSPEEKQSLRKNGLKIKRLAEFAPDEISILLNTTHRRAMEIAALIAFQSIPSIGPKFANDLVSVGIYTIDDLVGKDGSTLFNELELKQGFWTDPCVEDQFWLAVHFANHPGSKKNWWDFTGDRKAYREQHGYPAGRPAKAWHEFKPVMAG